MRGFAAAIGAVLMALSVQARAASDTAGDYGVGPWTEAVVSVADLHKSSVWLIEHGGWRVVAQGAVSRAELDYWRLPQSVSGAYRKLCAPLAHSGCIRFIRFDGAKGQHPIRLAARPWDTGGIFSIMLRSDDVNAAFKAAIALGWWAESEPYAFRFGASDLVNVVVRGPHGVNYAVYERRSPPFDAFPVGPLSRAFNSMRMVKRHDDSLAWYRDALGFAILFDAPYTDPAPGPNNFSIPSNLASSLVRRAAVVQPVLPQETGRIEVMQFEGFEGRSFASFASPPTFGILSVRYPVERFDAYRGRLSQQEVRAEYLASDVRVGGLGTLDLFAVRDPDGNLTEFYRAR